MNSSLGQTTILLASIITYLPGGGGEYKQLLGKSSSVGVAGVLEVGDVWHFVWGGSGM